MNVPGRFLLLSALLASLAPLPAAAQTSTGGASDWGLDLTVGGTGIAIGNVPRVNGIRLNLRDHDLEEINGLNLTLWSPPRNHHVGGTVRGLAVGLTGPVAGRLRGLSLGGLAVVAEEQLSGLGLGGLAVVGEGGRRGSSSAVWPPSPPGPPGGSTSAVWPPSARVPRQA